MSGERIIANGVNGLTGEYLLPPLDPADVAARAKEPPDDPAVAAQLRQLHAMAEQSTRGVFRGPVRRRSVQGGAGGMGRRVQHGGKAMTSKRRWSTLIEHRRRRIGDARTKVLEHRPGEGWTAWLARHGTAPGNVNPEKVPYYLLLIGGPNQIPFSLQYLLDTEYAVGRLDFDDADGYRGYVAGLIDYEDASTAPHDAAAIFFGTRHPFDGATQLSADSLVRPLIRSFQQGGRFASAVSGYQFDEVLGEPATKASLCEIFSGSGRVRPSGAVLLRLPRDGWLAVRPYRPTRAAWRAALPGLAGHRPDRRGPLLRRIRCPRGCPRTRACRILLRLLRSRHAAAETPSRTCRASHRRSWLRSRSSAHCRSASFPIRRAGRWRSSATSTGPGVTRSCREARRSSCHFRTLSDAYFSDSRSAMR